MTPEIRVDRATARHFLLEAFHLTRPGSLRDAGAALRALGFVQMDSINVCGRMHDLILQARVAGYRPEHLEGLLYGGTRAAFEYYFPNLCVLPLEDYRYFVPSMRRRAQAEGPRRALTDAELPIAEQLIARIAKEGPLRARFGSNGEGLTVSPWGAQQRIATRVLEKLWLHGRLAVHHRENFERWYDLTERALPSVSALHGEDASLPSPEEERAWQARKRLRARRLFRPTREDVRLLGEAAFVRVEVADAGRPWFVLKEDLESLTSARDAPPAEPSVRLLAPLDPLVYDRERTRALFGFEYVWEVYTPVAKRRWGYYSLPVLHGDRLVARIEPRLDRRTGTLRIDSLIPEPGVELEGFVEPLAARLREFAAFLGATKVRIGRLRPALPAGVRRVLTFG